MRKEDKSLYILMGLISAGLIAAGFLDQGAASTLKGLIILQLHPARLLNDYTLAGGTGAALVNAALVGIIGLVMVRLNNIRMSGPAIAAVFTMIGFGLFGKTPLNILPVIFGVYIAAKAAGKSFAEYILIAMFGTALGPLVTIFIAELGLGFFPGILLGIPAGVAAGMLLPALAIRMLHMHQGYNLYNLGFTCGFLALFAASLVTASGFNLTSGSVWNTEPSAVLIWLIPVISTVLITGGFLIGKKNQIADFLNIQKATGRLPSDFMESASTAGALINMGLLGFGGWIYVWAVGGDFNGPILGGMFTVIGFGAFGKHLKNCYPVVAGVFIGCLIFGKDPAAPGPLLAALFCTTLAPVAGEFGVSIGVLAGIIHLIMVERTGAWHSGMDLYNNGFAGGLTATMIVSVIEWFQANVKFASAESGDS